MRDLPTCADLPEDYCPSEKTPSPDLFVPPPDLEEDVVPPAAPEPQPETFCAPDPVVTEPPATEEPQPPVARAYFSEREEPVEPRQEAPEQLGPKEVHLSPPTSDAAWSAASVLRGGQSSAAKNSTGAKNNGCWQCS